MSGHMHAAAPDVISSLDDVWGKNGETIAQEMMEKINDYRSLLEEGRVAEARRYHDTLMNEIRYLRDEKTDSKVAIAAGAAAGAAAASVFFGAGAIVGAIAGGFIAYSSGQGQKEGRARLYEHLVAQLGPRPVE